MKLIEIITNQIFNMTPREYFEKVWGQITRIHNNNERKTFSYSEMLAFAEEYAAHQNKELSKENKRILRYLNEY